MKAKLLEKDALIDSSEGEFNNTTQLFSRLEDPRIRPFLEQLESFGDQHPLVNLDDPNTLESFREFVLKYNLDRELANEMGEVKSKHPILLTQRLIYEIVQRSMEGENPVTMKEARSVISQKHKDLYLYSKLSPKLFLISKREIHPTQEFLELLNDPNSQTHSRFKALEAKIGQVDSLLKVPDGWSAIQAAYPLLSGAAERVGLKYSSKLFPSSNSHQPFELDTLTGAFFGQFCNRDYDCFSGSKATGRLQWFFSPELNCRIEEEIETFFSKIERAFEAMPWRVEQPHEDIPFIVRIKSEDSNIDIRVGKYAGRFKPGDTVEFVTMAEYMYHLEKEFRD